MKEAFIVIRPSRFFKTKEALVAAGFNALYTKEVLGRGKQRVVYALNEGDGDAETVGIDFVAKRLLDIYVRDEDVDRLIEAVLSANSHGCPGDGKLFILPVENAVRVRTGEQGEDVLV